MIYVPPPLDPKKQDSGSNKIPGGLGQRDITTTEDGFIVDAVERAEHWLNLWANFWSPKRGWL